MSNYNVVDLGVLGPRWLDSSAFDISNNSHVAGISGDLDLTLPNYYHAFLWHNGNMKDLGEVGGFPIMGMGVNDSGMLVGTSWVGNRHGFLYDGQMKNLNQLMSSSDSLATDINSQGQVVGGAVFPGETDEHAFLFDQGSQKVKDLGTLGGGQSRALGVNDLGQVVGLAWPPNSSAHPFLYDKGKMTDLTPNDWGSAQDINELGQVVGWSGNHGTFLFSNGQIKYLGVDGFAWGINNVGQVVGGSTVQWSAWIYTEQDGVVDLNTLIPPNSGLHLGDAWSINDSGMIVGTGSYQDHARAYLLTPTLSLQRQKVPILKRVKEIEKFEPVKSIAGYEDPGIFDPRILTQILTRLKNLEGVVSKGRAFIKEDERPEVGKEAESPPRRKTKETR